LGRLRQVQLEPEAGFTGLIPVDGRVWLCVGKSWFSR